ncbi:MAG TPA: APC family permease [Thermoanaerobaculia bacterium]|nr:APC family permease [Thermoanaerobaculia bacterium]
MTAGSSLERAVSRWQIVGLALNDVVGSGVYLLPAAAAAFLGFASLWAVVAAGAAVLLLVLCFAEAGGYFDGPGSAYLYARTAFGEFIGFEVGWMTWLARVSSVASLSAGFAQALTYLWPATGSGIGRALAILFSIGSLTLINVIGVRSGARAAVVLAICKILPLLVFVGVGIWVARAAVALSTPPGSGRLGEAALLLLYAYAGFENTAAPAGEYKNPRRDVPFALLAQIAIVTLLYTAVQWVALGTLPSLAQSQTPLADAGRLFLGRWGGWLLTVGGAISILGTNSNTVLTGPRYLFALAEDGFGPRALAYVHPRFRTPAVAILVQSTIALLLALSGSFARLAALSVIARLASYLGTAAAIPFLRRKLGNRQTLRLPGGPLIPLAACLVCITFVLSATVTDLVAGGLALLAGLPVYFLRRADV